MSRNIIVMLGLLVLVVLIFICVRNHTPAIQQDILISTTKVLSPVSSDWLTISASGRKVILKGVAPTETLRRQAGEMATTVHGVVSVDNQITLFESELDETKQKDADLFVIRPYKSIFSKQGKKIVLSGVVPDVEQHVRLLQSAEEKFGKANVTDQLKTGLGAPSGWLKSAELAVINLLLFEDGTATLTDTQLDLLGHITDQATKNIIKGELERHLPKNFKVKFDLKVSQLAVTKTLPASAKQQLGSTCADKFKQNIADLIILFSTDSVAIMSSEMERNVEATLQKVLDYSVICPNVIIQVAGYTDNRGSSQYNLKLSHQRALQVSNALIEKGVPENRIKPVGFGQNNPLSENTTSSGQAINRRIEFKYLHEGE